MQLPASFNSLYGLPFGICENKIVYTKQYLANSIYKIFYCAMDLQYLYKYTRYLVYIKHGSHYQFNEVTFIGLSLHFTNHQLKKSTFLRRKIM
jgi:hypothetical protein